MHRKFLLTILIISFCFSGWAQSVKPVLFQSGIETFPANLSQFIRTAVPAYDIVAQRYYRWVQFEETPTEAVRKGLEKEGLRFLSYIPYATYLVSIPEDYDRSSLGAAGVRAVVRPTSLHKVSHLLREESLPDWALVGQDIDLVVQYPGDLSPMTVLAQLETLGAELLEEIANEPSLVIRASISKIYHLANLPSVTWVEPIPHPGEPEDVRGRGLHRANMLASQHPTGRHYDGRGIKVMVRDDGGVGPHIDFENRTNQSLAPAGGGTHGDGVAGVFAGAGNLDPTNQGAASGSEVYVLNYQAAFTDQTLPLHLSDTVMITNSSYSNGCNAGYTTNTQRVDQQTYNNPSLLHVFSAGNSNNSDCGYGAGNQWGNITGGHKQGKNVIATANLFADGSLVGSSSRGPAHDGRIKPDISAHGQGQISTNPNNTYVAFGGTSAAAPSAAGVVAQLYQAYREMNGNQYPQSSLIKAIVLNTAEDIGNPGPDYRFGWGRINGYRAVRILETNQYFQDNLSQGQANTHTLAVPANVQEMRVMVYWMDREGMVNAARALVNNLDMTLTDPVNTVHFPLVLDPTPNVTTLNQPAVPGIDSLNNMEQVRIVSPAAGNYTLTVGGTDIPFGAQAYWVVYDYWMEEITVTYPHGGEGFVPGETEILHWDANPGTGNFTLEYSLDNGSNWNLIGIAAPDARLFNWNVPSGVADSALVRVTRGTTVGQSAHPFHIIEAPQNLTVSAVCSNSVQLVWDAVPGASSYTIYQLGFQYMDSVEVSTSNSVCVPITHSNQTNWFAVSAHTPGGGEGRRSLAVVQNPGIFNCQGDDLAAFSLSAPDNNYYSACFTDTLFVSLNVVNVGLNAQTGFQLSYQLNADPVVTQTYSGTLNGCSSIEYNFATPLTTLFPAINQLKVWTSLAGDQNAANDTLLRFIQLDNTVLTLPVAEDFETFGLCGTSSNCEDEICNLSNGWYNLVNGEDDDIDWRVDLGGTPSAGTGPDIDHNPGTSLGRYLYLEGSGGCSNQEAIMQSACIDLAGTVFPEMRFWYHMLGTDIASLHVDVFDGITWQNDVMPPLVGEQGPQWLQASVDLSAFVGSLIQIRIRAYTGQGFEGDIAIDDILILETNAPPLVDFSANATEICTGQTIAFSDLSQLNPTSWSWSFFPNTVSYLNGTDSTSQSPVVQFNANGNYTVSLTATNGLGSNTGSQPALIQVSDGLQFPFTEDFEAFGLCGIAPDCEDEVCPLSNGWLNLVNGAEDDIDWRVDENGTFSAGTGPAIDHNPGTTSGNYLYLEASGGCDNQEAIMLSPCLDLANLSAPRFSFWYHMQGADIGSLHVDAFNGTTWDLDIMPALVGEQASVWQQAIVDLSAYAGNVIQIRLRGITGTGFQGDIAIDDFSFGTAATAAFGLGAGSVCEGTATLVSDSSVYTGAPSFQWNFGAGASPATANTPGPHGVTWNTPGTKTVQLILTDAFGSTTATQTLNVDPLPNAGFTASSSNGYKFSFVNSSANTNTFFWDFGDGNTSTALLPSHTYGANGQFDITLLATNSCGTDTLVQTVTVSNVVPPTAVLTLSDSVLCPGETLTFESQSYGIGTLSYQWDFGQDASPATANVGGPHVVSYQSPGTKMVVLAVANGTGTSYDTSFVEVEPLPLAAFSDSLLNGQTFGFNNLSQNGVAYFWDFGDGNSSSLVQPTHTYTLNGNYTISLVTTNACGSDTAFSMVNISNVGLEKDLQGLQLGISPNPNQGIFSLWVEGDRQGNIEVALIDVTGKSLQHQAFYFPGGAYQHQITAENVARGVYLLRIHLEGETVYRKVVIR